MDTKGPLHHACEENQYIYVVVDHFSNYLVTDPTPKSDQFAVNSNFHNWISKHGQPQKLITDRGTEYLNSDIAKCSAIFVIRQS